MWKWIAALVFISVLPRAGVQAAAPEQPIGRDTVRMAITIFRRTPTNQQGSMVRPIIIRYAQESTDVRVDLYHVSPWIGGAKGYDEVMPVLLTAYIAGSVRAQLDGRKAKDDPVAGTEQVLATYQQMQRDEPKLRIMELERLIDLKRHGKLAKHMETRTR